MKRFVCKRVVMTTALEMKTCLRPLMIKNFFFVPFMHQIIFFKQSWSMRRTKLVLTTWAVNVHDTVHVVVPREVRPETHKLFSWSNFQLGKPKHITSSALSWITLGFRCCGPGWRQGKRCHDFQKLMDALKVLDLSKNWAASAEELPQKHWRCHIHLSTLNRETVERHEQPCCSDHQQVTATKLTNLSLVRARLRSYCRMCVR